MTHLFFDTETTGLPDKRLPTGHESQPRICQIAAIETDDSGRTMNEVNFLIKPAAWSIPEKASAIHGITQDVAERYGIRIEGALAILRRLVSRSVTVIAHNLDFDAWMLHREAVAVTGEAWSDLHEKGFCTMNAATDVVKRPPTERMLAKGMTGFKRPNLQEAYRHFFGRDFDGAHNAMDDAGACRDVHFALRRHGEAAGGGMAA